MGATLNLLRYPDGQGREQRLWLLWGLGLGAVLGALATQVLTWQVEASVQRDAAHRLQEKAEQALRAEQAHQAKVQQLRHERRLLWQGKVQGVLAQQAQAEPIWQTLPQLSLTQGVRWSRLQWVAQRWSLHGQSPDMAAVVRVREGLLTQQGVRSELKTWVAPLSSGEGGFQLEWTWPPQPAKP